MRTFQVTDIKNEYSDNIYITSRFLTCFFSILLCTIYIYFLKFSLYQFSIILSYMIFRCIEAFVDVIHGINQKKWRMDYIGISFLIRGFSTLLIFSLLSFLYKNLLISIIGILLISLLLILIYDIPKIKIKLNIFSQNYLNILSLLIKCFPLMIVILINTFIISFARYSIERKYGVEALGIYSSVITPTIVIQLLAYFIFTPLINIFADYIKKLKYKYFIMLFLFSCLFIFIITIIIYFFSFIFGEYGLLFLFGNSILNYSYLLPEAVIVAGITAILMFMNIIFSTIRDIRGILYGNLIGLIICIILINYILNKYELSGGNYILIISLGTSAIYLFIRFFWFFKNNFLIKSK